MCVSGVRSRVVSCERVCVSCEWASRRSSVVRREAFSFVLRSWFRSFRVEFWIRILSSILEFDFSNSRSRVLKSNFEFDFFVSLLYSISRISLLYSISRISIFDSNLSSKFSCRRAFRLLEFRLLDSSALNFEFVFSCRVCRRISNSSWSIRLLEFRWAFRLLEVRFAIRLSNLSSKFDNYQYYSQLTYLNYSRTIALASLSLPRELCARFSCVKY